MLHDAGAPEPGELRGETGADGAQSELLRVGELEVRPDDGLAVIAGRALTLSVREFQVLVALSRRAGRIVSRRQLYETVWGAPMRPGERSADVYVAKLRAKLNAANPDWRFIHTHVGFGYRLSPEPSQSFHNSATGR